MPSRCFTKVDYCKLVLITSVLLGLLVTDIADAVEPSDITALADAEQLLLRGNYAESLTAYSKLHKSLPVQATLGLARGYWQQGKYKQALEALDEQLLVSIGSAALHAERALLSLEMGKWTESREHTAQAIKRDPEHAQARWVEAELWRSEGKIAEACRAYEALAERYDRRRQRITSPRELYWFAQALAQHARLNQDKKRFRELTQDIYPRVLMLDPNFWQAHCETGLLLLEKFNASDAEAALNDALEINPLATEARVGLAYIALDQFQLEKAKRQLDRAQRVNPQHVAIAHCQTDLELASLSPQKALPILEAALEIRPREVGTLGRLAATHQLLINSQSNTHQQARDALVEKARSFATNLGEFYAVWGNALERARRYPQAAVRLRKATKEQPQLLGVRGRLGMIEMRLGHEEIARQWLEESFERDPYNVRVKNQLEVLDLLKDYDTLETEHFVIRYDRAHDQALAECMARYAEQCYGEFSVRFDFELPEKALIEVFCESGGVSARQWFGARMVGLPNIHTIAACSGNVVAMVSPTAMRRKNNWADVLRHEIVHLINIQQTEYAVPHWLTEGCAVWQENRPRRLHWEKLLVERISSGNVFDLQSLNLGFIRPRSPDDWQLAYCQAEIYLNLIVEQFGEAGVRKLLAAYRSNLLLKEAFSTLLSTKLEDFEEDYVKRLKEINMRLSRRSDLKKLPKLTQLTALWESAPNDLDVGAKLALVRLRRGDYPGAGRLAEAVMEREPKQPLARLVKAKLLVRIGDDTGAQKVLGDLSRTKLPTAESLKLLAGIHLRRKEWDQAQHLYELGAQQYPNDLQWTKALAVVAIRKQDSAGIERLLTRIAQTEPDNLVARKKLLQLALEKKQQEEIEHWANEVLHIDPNNHLARQFSL